MKISVHSQPCLLQEAVELVHAFVNQTPIEQLTGPGYFCIPAEEVLRIRAEACEGLDPDSEEVQFFFHGVPFEDKREGLSSLARYMVYSWASDIITDVDEMSELLLRNWRKYRKGLLIDNVSLNGIGVKSSPSGEFHSIAKEIAKLPFPVTYQMQLVEMLSNFEFYLHRLLSLLRPVVEKLEPMLEPWVQRALPLVRQWEAFFSNEDNIRTYIMQRMAIESEPPQELRCCLRYFQPNSGYACLADSFRVYNMYQGVGLAVSTMKPKAAREALESCDYMVLRQLANSDRMSMLLAMMATPMTAQELSQKLELHSGSVFRDLNSMSNSNLLIREVVNGKRIYRTNYTMLQNLFEEILRMLESERAH